MVHLSDEVNRMGPLIDAELERVDRKHAQLTQLSGDLVDALGLYHTLMREQPFSGAGKMGYGYQPPSTPMVSPCSPTEFHLTLIINAGLLHINDLLEATSCPVHSFADDSTLRTASSSRAPIPATQIRNERRRNVDNINMDLATIFEWGSNNLVEFNANKTQVCFFSRKADLTVPNISFSGVTIPLKTSILMLGITISSNLSWDNHCSTQTYPETVRFCPKKGNSSRGDASLTNSLTSLEHRRKVGDLALFYRYFYGRCSPEISTIVPPLAVPARLTVTTDTTRPADSDDSAIIDNITLVDFKVLSLQIKKLQAGYMSPVSPGIPRVYNIKFQQGFPPGMHMGPPPGMPHQPHDRPQFAMPPQPGLPPQQFHPMMAAGQGSIPPGRLPPTVGQMGGPQMHMHQHEQQLAHYPGPG
ncbi:unnamed protein product [Phaedon cochleariae]|uniref:Uncharacterized protein n=1 Tax=Phaedon cochleariae TaxID=80249 RepID=A0A9N9SBJ4_PHACE|nr:unnamed protein product [Phaedon cochleariae]